MSPTLVKVGGSLSERGDPRPALAVLREQAVHHPLVVVPGGAEFAEAVRRADARFRLTDPTAHRMALLAMDQYGLLLADLAGLPPATTLAEALYRAEAGGLALLLPAGEALRSPLPPSWEITSDSIAAYLAGRVKAERLILLKDVDGFQGPDGRLRRRLPAREATGVVDPAFPTWLPATTRCWILNGSVPSRLAELLQTGTTLGTEVLP